MVHFVKVMSELGAGTRGASLGYEALRIASYKLGYDLFEKREVIDVEEKNELLSEEVELPNAIRVEGIVEMYSKIAKGLQTVYKSGNFPFVISGDHSNGGGTIAGIKKQYPNQRLGVVWIDAHADLHSPFTSPTGNVHGMPLATALSEDNVECKVNEPKPETISAWNELKGDSPRIKHSDLVFIGVRDTESPEDELMKRHAIPNFTVDQLRREGVEAILEKSLNHLSDCDIIYVSFDVDSMDPSVSRGTGTPVENGITPDEATELLLGFSQRENLVAMEITEINPLLDDKGNAMAETSLVILDKVVNQLEKSGK